MNGCRMIRLLLLGLITLNTGVRADAPIGPKKRVAIMDLKDKSQNEYRFWSHVGSGMSDMIATALAKSGRCIVLERERLEDIEQEQALARSGAVLASTGAESGKLTGASLILTGDVTEFGVQRKEFKVGELSRILPFGGDASLHSETARCVLDLRFIDTTTGHVVAAEQAVGEVTSRKISEDIGVVPSISFGSERFDRTLIGKATRQAVDKAVALMEAHLQSVPWYGRIVKVDQNRLFVNTGVEDGRHAGDEFTVARSGEPLLDPDTGDALGSETIPVGRIRLVSILGPRLSTAVAIEGQDLVAGDVVQ